MSVRACISAAPEAGALHHMLWEIVDNAVDEAANGFATTVSVTINRDNSVVVE